MPDLCFLSAGASIACKSYSRLRSARSRQHDLVPPFRLFSSPRPVLGGLAIALSAPLAHRHAGQPLICITGLGVGSLMAVISALQSDSWRISPAIQRYGAICAFLMNVPFAINLYMARHVPPTELSIVIATSPFFNFMLALATGWDRATPSRLLAMLAGFASTLVLILSREGMLAGQFSWWLIASFAVPILYCGYNTYAGRAWPAGADTMKVEPPKACGRASSWFR